MNEALLKMEVAKQKEKLALLVSDIKLEEMDNHIAAEILIRLLEKRPVSSEEIIFLKEQSIDLAKVLTLLGLQVIPGSSIVIIMLEKIAEKHGFTLLPKSDRTRTDIS